MKNQQFKIITGFLFLLLFTFSTINATDGYRRHGYGIKYSALAGAGSALTLSSLISATNPAGLVFLDNRFDINIGLFSPAREFTITGNPSGAPGTFGLAPGTVESESNYFPMPTLGANYRLNEDMSVGLMFYGNGGMNTDYPAAVFGDPNSPATGVNLEQMFFAATYAIKLNENHALGVSGIFAFQRFAAQGLASLGGFSSDAANLSGNRLSTSTGFGVRFGYMGKILPYLSVGASYQTKMNMGEFDEYKGLFAQQGDFDIPASWVVGIAADVTKDLTVAADVNQIYYSGVKSVGTKFNLTQPLGSEDGAGFGWEDMTIFKLGLMYKGVEDWTFMGGFSYGKQPIGETEVLFNILAPAVIESHITFGVSKQFDTNELNVAFMYALPKTVEGPNPLEAPGAQQIAVKMYQWQVEVGYSLPF